MHRFINFILIFLLYANNAQAVAPVVTVAPVKFIEIANQQEIIGQVIALDRSELSSDLSAIIDNVIVEVGASVAAGEIVARLDKKRFELNFAAAKARLESMQAKVEQAEYDAKIIADKLKREETLFGTPGYSKAKVKDLENELNSTYAKKSSAIADLNYAKIQVDFAILDLERSDIRAPFSGFVTKKFLESGDYVKTGDAILSIVSDQKFEIEANIPKTLIDYLTKDITAKIADDLIITLKTKSIIKEENILSKTLPVRFVPDKNDLNKLMVNQSLSLFLPTSDKKLILTIPKDALLINQEQYMVFVVINSVVVPKFITIGSSSQENIEIVSGLNKDELVIIKGNERVHPGQKVNILQ